MALKTESIRKTETATIYLHVDHLDKGRYKLHILQDDTVIKKVAFKK